MEEVDEEEASYFRIFRSPGDFNNGARTPGPTGDAESPGHIQYLSRLARTNLDLNAPAVLQRGRYHGGN